MIVLALAAAAILAFRLWTRLQATQSMVVGLEDRIKALEDRAGTVAVEQPHAAARTVEPIVAPTPRPVVERPVPPAARPTMPPPPVVRPAPPPLPSMVVSAPATAEGSTIASSRSDARDALETRIGSRWLLYVGVVAIIIGVSYFEKLAIDNHWIGETARIIQGALVGSTLVAAGLAFVRKGYRTYGQVLSGGGIAVLYVSTYAAFNFYHLIAQPVAFVLMSAVTLLAAWLADHQRSQSLALVAVGGGFATPFLLPSGVDAEIALFGYETILIAGTMLLSRRRDWPTLNVVSYAFTVLTVGAWAARFYDASKYIPTELFLTVFCAMYLFILRETRHSNHRSARAERAILWTAPLLYYISSLAVLGPHSAALLVYLLLLSFVGVAVSARGNSPLRLAFWAAAAAPMLPWSNDHAGTWLAAGLTAWATIYALNVIGLCKATLDEGRRFNAADIVLLHLNGLIAYAGAYVLIEPVHLAAAAPLAATFALVHGLLSVMSWNRQRDEALHFAALAFTLLTVAIALQFDGPWTTTAWAAEGAVVVSLGLRERRTWLRLSGLALFAVAVSRLLALQFSDPWIGQVVLFNRRALSGAFVIGLTYALAIAHRRWSVPAKRAMHTGIALVSAKLLILALAVSEIAAYWKLRTPPPFVEASEMIAAALIVGAVTMRLGLVRRQEWMRGIGGAIVVFAAFALFSMQMERAPLGYVTLLNARAITGLFAILTLYGLASLHRRHGEHISDLPINLAIFVTGASLLSLSLLTSEIDAFWAARGAADTWSIAREGLHAIVWAGVGSFLVWHGLSNRRTWVRAIGAALLVVAILRLVAAQFSPAAPSYLVLANARVLASIVVVALLYGLARLYRDVDDVVETQYAPYTVLTLAANALTLTLLTSEITAYWRVNDIRHLSTATSATSQFAREMMLSITWALYATLLIVVGLKRRYAPIRYFAIGVFVVTIVKVFAIDLAELDRIYRVLSVVGLGVMLLITSYLYQRSRVEQKEA